jgi:multiple sugar transport system permease protein
MALLYLVLSIGALTTIYPFAVMMVTGFKGPTDQNDNSLKPRFWDEFATIDAKTNALAPESLMGKYLFDKYSGDASMIASTRIGAEAAPSEVEAYEKFLMSLPVDTWAAGFRTAPSQSTGRLTMRYQAWLRTRYATVDDLNKAYIEENAAFQTVQPPTEMLERKTWQVPTHRKYKEWLEFKATLPAEFRLPIREQRLWQEFLRGKFQNQIANVPASILGGAPAFESIRLPAADALTVDGKPTELSETFRAFRAGLTPRALALPAWADSPFPIAAYETSFVRAHEAEVKQELSTRNYRYVLDYVALNGRALWNTAIFCLLAIAVQLTVNPLAAYALSRFPMKSTGKILLFLLATMAFPAEVAMIPSFLLLKDLGLLNTFAALVLPTAASGYMIFLLKGFFDSLPPELYESGQIDGAKETTMMLRIALPLSRPVLGYMALLAFMGAYGAFLYAFLVAQDQKIWTLMVFIYQLQNTAPKSVMMAALTLAALPTLVVFLLAQRVIMRGIILPGDK